MTGDVPFPTAPDEDLLPTVVPQHGHLGFTLRELIIVGTWLLAFALSFAPGAGSILDVTSTVWTMNGAWILTIGVPTVATFLIVLRRLSPEGIRRVGSLGIDQFASVAYSVAAVSWAVLLWQQIMLVTAVRQSLPVTWAAWLDLLLMLGLVAVTVFAARIPRICEDFDGRMETLAHRNADPVRPVIATPRPTRAHGSVADPSVPGEGEVVVPAEAVAETEPAAVAELAVSAEPVVQAESSGSTGPTVLADSGALPEPGLSHGEELGAAGHASAGTSVASALGAAGYVPRQRRGSFLASGENTEEAPADAPVTSPTTVASPTSAVSSTAAETDDLQPRIDASRAEEPEPRSEESDPEPEPAPEPKPEPDREPEPESPQDKEDFSNTDALTAVLGDLLEPSREDDVETRAVDVSPAASQDRPRARAAARAGEQAQPFWALAPEVREVHDARGDEIFTIGPDAWILVLEDRGGAFVVRHDDGRVGYLHDTDNMTRG